jgi:serine/threonine-protein kinase
VTETHLAHHGIAVRPGDVFAGKYRVERIVGRGGMGLVVAAHHLQLDERVALKFLLPEALVNPEAVARFLREARAAAKIKNEHVARVSDVGQLENGCPYIVMELLTGMDLSTWLRQRGQLPVELAVDFVLQTCEAIADAHAIGIVHRDLKPANLFCVQRSDGRLSIKVLDFGISKVTGPGAADHDMTRTNSVVGSPYYMSPEHLQSSKHVDTRTDIWSIGVILFELIAGATPFQAEGVTGLAIQIATTPAPPLRSLRADAPPELEQVVAKCLQKSPAHRYQNVGELAIALKDFGGPLAGVAVDRVLGTLRQAGIATVPPTAPALALALAPAQTLPPPPSSRSGTAATWGQASRVWNPVAPRPVGKVALVVGSMAAVAGLVLGGALLLRRQAAPGVHAASSAPAAPELALSSNALSVATPAPSPPPSVVLAPPPADSATEAAPPADSPAPSPAPAPRPAPAARTSAVPPSLPKVSASAAPPGCAPPFTLDADGHKHFKPECYLNH